MFSKCLKHEWKAVARYVVPLLVAILATSVVMAGIFMLDGLWVMPKLDPSSLGGVIVNISKPLLEAGLALLIMASIVSVFVATVRRFYTSFFTDEGYLTFTLPVPMHCHLMTKIVSILLWGTIGAIVTMVAILVALCGYDLGYGTQTVVTLATELPRVAMQVMTQIFADAAGTSSVLAILLLILSVLEEILLLYFVISLGAMLTRKHRFLAALGCIIGVNMVSSMVQSCMMAIYGIMNIGGHQINTVMTSILISGIVFEIIKILVFYMGTHAILVKKLNLE